MPAHQAHDVRFILFDDVYTSGATSGACRQVLAAATGVSDITGMYITKTSARRSWDPAHGVVRRFRSRPP